MKFIEHIEEKIRDNLPIQIMLRLVLFFLTVWLFLETWTFWSSIVKMIWKILCPFVIGFAIAYILRAPISWGEKHHIRRGYMIGIVYAVIGLFLVWLIGSLIPMVLTRSTSFMSSMINGVNWLYEQYGQMSAQSAPDWVSAIVSEATNSLSDIRNLIPNFTSQIPDFLNEALGVLTTSVFAIIISIFMSIGWDHIRYNIAHIARRISRTCYECVFAVNDELSAYIRSLLVIMLIKFVEYSIVYIVIGHTDWLILGLLTSLSLLVPYIGPTIVNCIGILTALTLPGANVLILLILILVLSNVDEYVIALLVHSHNTAVTPLWALFSIFAGGALMGTVGVVIAIPAFLAIRVIYLKLRKQYFDNEEIPA